jgi:hypothetical protein
VSPNAGLVSARCGAGLRPSTTKCDHKAMRSPSGKSASLSRPGPRDTAARRGCVASAASAYLEVPRPEGSRK